MTMTWQLQTAEPMLVQFWAVIAKAEAGQHIASNERVWLRDNLNSIFTLLERYFGGAEGREEKP